MWKKSYSFMAESVCVDEVWNVWTDVNRWSEWQDDIEQAELKDSFTVGARFKFKPKGAPLFFITVTDIEHQSFFTDLTKLPFAKMYDKHEIIQHPDYLELKSTITITGPMTFLWKHLIGKGIVNSLPLQSQKLVQQVFHVREESI